METKVNIVLMYFGIRIIAHLDDKDLYLNLHLNADVKNCTCSVLTSKSQGQKSKRIFLNGLILTNAIKSIDHNKDDIFTV